MWMWNWQCEPTQPPRKRWSDNLAGTGNCGKFVGQSHYITTQFPSPNIYKETPIYQVRMNQSSPRWRIVRRPQLRLLLSFFQAALHPQASILSAMLIWKQRLPFACWRSKTFDLHWLEALPSSASSHLKLTFLTRRDRTFSLHTQPFTEYFPWDSIFSSLIPFHWDSIFCSWIPFNPLPTPLVMRLYFWTHL